MKIQSIIISFLALISQLFSANAMAAAKVSYLNVDGDNVHFSTAEAKSAASPACVVAETNERFAVSLRTEAGRAMYSLLITAMSSDQPVTVVSGSDCGDVFGLERAQSVSISPDVTNEAGGAKSLYLYKGDGVTKLGRIINMGTTENKFYYQPVDSEVEVRQYTNSQLISNIGSIYYQTNDCTGTAYIADNKYIGSHGTYNDGKLLTRIGGRLSVITSSYLTNSGQCGTITPKYMNLYGVSPYIDSLCGDAACIIREE
ncbi:hypothetical protein [Thalassomonas sp. RHCl1]|uniref:hypothetical protein n=1 Tax=Thalassomonas sp. RHCl1 TaxID=2995320 RepID=UPI00248B279A|nr:hypothetical protein [Thalassomonas sp. RHCl1]